MKLVFLVFQLLLLTENIDCSGEGEIKLVSYKDSSNCGGGDTCDFYFKNVVIKDEDGNEFLNVAETDDTGNTIMVLFSGVEKLNKVIPVNIHTGRSITISFEVWDEDTGNDDHERTMLGLVVPFSGIRSDGSWWEKSFISNINKENEKREATLKIKYRILRCDSHFTGLGCNSCVANYYGTECGKYCKPVSGHYTCHPTTGSKVCAEKRAGIECDDCVDHFEGNNCERCVQNYYPIESCNILCIPNPERYICTNEGEKQCLQYRTGSDCEDCVANHYGEECSKTCHETSSYTCDESGEKHCKEHFYPPHICDTRCVQEQGNYTCNQTTGDKICAEGKEGEDCDECQNRNKEGVNCEKCIEQHYGENCTVYCKPDIKHYNCFENGIKLCIDNTTLAEHNCRRPNQTLNIPVIGAAGGGIGLFLILLLTCIILKVRKDRNKNVAEEILIGETDNTQRNQNQEAIHPTVNNQAADSSEETGDVYSRINRQEQGNRKKHPQIGPDQDALYSTIQSQPVYATVYKGDKYARLDRHEGTSNGTYSAETGKEPTYADVSFVRNERGDDVVTFRNAAQNRDNGVEGTGQDGEEATYITVSQVIEERL